MTININSVPDPVPPPSPRQQTGQRIRMDDGTGLVADLYVPDGTPPFPAVVEITPYSSRRLASLGEVYATRGYLFAAVDARGRYRSGGEWEPLTHDRADGHAVLRWLGTHPLCNGRVGSRGHSYSGYNQLLAAIDAPAALQAMAVGVAPGDPFTNVPFQGGAYDLNDFFWLLSMTGRVCTEEPDAEEPDTERFAEPEETGTAQAAADAAADEARDLLFDKLLRMRPLREMDLAFGVRQPVFREWLDHWRLDDFWLARSVGPHLARTAVPTLYISGWWDGNGRGATAFFRGMRERAATTRARERQRLLIGAWDHDLAAPDCDDLPEHEATQIRRAAQRSALNDELAWFDRHLRDVPTGPSTGQRVSLFLTGAWQWRDFDDWPPAESVGMDYLLGATADSPTGTLAPAHPPGNRASSTYRFDPGDPTPFAPPDVDAERMPFDNSGLEAARDDLLLFDTAPAPAPLLLVGELAVSLYASADTPDFDLCAKLLDVYPDGRAIYLADGIIRARFRAGWEHPAPVTPGAVLPYRIDLWHIGHLLRPGHALRLEIASGAFLRFDVNPCSGDDLADATTTHDARITLHHDADYPSALHLPVCPAASVG